MSKIQLSCFYDFDISFLNRSPFPNFPTWHRDARDKLKRKWKFKNGVLKTRCPSCQCCLRVIPSLVVGLANWLSTPRLPVFGGTISSGDSLPILQIRAWKASIFELCLPFSLSLSLFLLAHFSGILNFNIPLLEFSPPLYYERSII